MHTEFRRNKTFLSWQEDGACGISFLNSEDAASLDLRHSFTGCERFDHNFHKACWTTSNKSHIVLFSFLFLHLKILMLLYFPGSNCCRRPQRNVTLLLNTRGEFWVLFVAFLESRKL